MPNVTLLGRVLPDAIKINLILPAIDWAAPDIGLILKFEIQIVQSAITVKCETNRFNGADDIGYIWQRAFDLVRSAVDLISFADGRGLTVVLDGIIDPVGVGSNLIAEDITLKALVTAIHLDKNFDEIWRIVLSDPAIFQALNDLVVGISVPHLSVINCARAVEGLSHIIGGVGLESDS